MSATTYMADMVPSKFGEWIYRNDYLEEVEDLKQQIAALQAEIAAHEGRYEALNDAYLELLEQEV